MITRLSENALKNILTGKTQEAFKCVIKFYSNSCPYCHELKNDYESIAERFGDNVHFFAFNTYESDNLDNFISIDGVPSIAFVDVKDRPKISILGEPEEPSKETWYHADDIIKFIKGNLNA